MLRTWGRLSFYAHFTPMFPHFFFYHHGAICAQYMHGRAGVEPHDFASLTLRLHLSSAVCLSRRESHHLSITWETLLLISSWLPKCDSSLTSSVSRHAASFSPSAASLSQSGGVWRQQWNQGTLRESFNLLTCRSGRSGLLRGLIQSVEGEASFLAEDTTNFLSKMSSISILFDTSMWLVTLRYLLG